MTRPMQDDARARIEAGLAAILVHALLGLALVWGLGMPMPRQIEDALDVFDVAPPAPPPPPEVSPPPPPRQARAAEANRRSAGREGAASPPNLRSDATQIVAPLRIVPLPVPSPVIAAPVAGTGGDPSTGSADIRGPGFGAGGVGDGRGSGAGGDGDGGGGIGRGGRPPRLLRGRLRDSDYPRAAVESGSGGTVSIRFTVALDGRAVNCRITGSSGNAALDATTCRLIERRYRFDPSRDERGRPVLSDVVEDHEWVSYDEPPERGRDDD